jgi:hypothetical protein
MKRHTILIAILVTFLSVAGTISGQDKTATPTWSSLFKGTHNFNVALAVGVRSKRLTLEQANKAHLLAVDVGKDYDFYLGELARRLQTTWDFDTVYKDLLQAAQYATTTRPAPDPTPQAIYCFLMAGAVEHGCLMGGADAASCASLADSYYCDCMGGININGFCL